MKVVNKKWIFDNLNSSVNTNSTVSLTVKKIIQKDKKETETKSVTKEEKKKDIILQKKKHKITKTKKKKKTKKSKY